MSRRCCCCCLFNLACGVVEAFCDRRLSHSQTHDRDAVVIVDRNSCCPAPSLPSALARPSPPARPLLPWQLPLLSSDLQELLLTEQRLPLRKEKRCPEPLPRLLRNVLRQKRGAYYSCKHGFFQISREPLRSGHMSCPSTTALSAILGHEVRSKKSALKIKMLAGGLSFRGRSLHDGRRVWCE